jgi:protein-tyrosine phosphatase
MQKLKDVYLTTILHLQRVIDHTYRRLTGLPMAKRSMITPNLYLGGQYGLYVTKKFEKLGITAVVNMRMSPNDQYRFPGLLYLHLPTLDQHAPTLTQLHEGVKFITQVTKNDGKVYIHCRHGEGRGPTMAIAYLMSTGLSFEEAFTFVKKVRTFIMPTYAQTERLKEFEKEIRK